jgi:Cellulase (glycosyl hydrolase family 5)
MRTVLSIWFIILTMALSSCGRSPGLNSPLSLNPQNPHYFLYHGKPLILIGSTEHYGAVMNLDFDYLKYLNEIASSGLNVTRTFSGAYVEPQGAFGILKNTLAPAPGRYICPWARSSEPGYINGGKKFDLSKWDEAYFTRLKDFLSQASKRNIIVELDLFSNYYDTIQWYMCPLYIKNNINGIGNLKDHKEVLSLRHPEILDIQEKMVRKIINELKDFDNLYYEVCNEPYFGDTIAEKEWEKHMTGIVVEAEKGFNKKHLISNNIANNYKLVPEIREGVSVYNFHYARPPVTVAMNYHLNKVIGDNETGFDGIRDSKYRTEAWDFILSGGGLFNNLDYSFATGNEDGSFAVRPGEPGGGGKVLRNQLKILAGFMNGIDYINMEPLKNDNIGLLGNSGINVQALAKDDEIIAMYIHRKDTVNASSSFEIELTPGSYSMTWADTKSGTENVSGLKDHKGGLATINTPLFSEDIALKILKEKIEK